LLDFFDSIPAFQHNMKPLDLPTSDVECNIRRFSYSPWHCRSPCLLRVSTRFGGVD
jgi:hypothetical protein